MKRLYILSFSLALILLLLLLGCEQITPANTTEPGKVESEIVSIAQIFSNPEKYNGKYVTIEGYLFSGWEWFGIAEDYIYDEYIRSAGGWITIGGQPKIKINQSNMGKRIEEIKNRLYWYGQPKSLVGKARITGEFQLSGDKGQWKQIAPIEMNLLPWLPPPSSVLPQGELTISKVPCLGETAQLTLTFYAKSSAYGLAGQPPTQAWIEFERYEPTLYYPLGTMGRVKTEAWIDWLKNPLSHPGVRFPAHSLFLKDALVDQKESLVLPASILVSGSNEWKSPATEVPDQVQLSSTVRFTEEGWYYVSGWIGGETWQAKQCDYLLFTVSKDSGIEGWPQNMFSNIEPPHHPINPGGNVLVYAKPSAAPVAGKDLKLSLKLQIVNELYDVYSARPDIILNARANILIFKRTQQSQTGLSDWQQEVALTDLLVDGNLNYQGKVERGTSIYLEGTLRFPEGDWLIKVCGDDTLGFGDKSTGEHQRIYIHVGKDKSWYGWPVKFPYDS